MTDRIVRNSARVVVVDTTGSVLLCRIDDPRDTKAPLWITPGGGMEPGEDAAATAARELREETGHVVAPGDLGAPIAVCRGEWTFRGQPLYSVDWFFGWRTERFTPVEAELTSIEREVHDGWRWWTPGEIETAREIVLPGGLAGIVLRLIDDDAPTVPVELPWTSA